MGEANSVVQRKMGRIIKEMDVVQRLEELLLSYEGGSSIFFTDYDGGIVLTVGDLPRFKNGLILGHLNVIGQIPKLLMGEHESSYFQFDSSQLVVHSICRYYIFVHAGNNANAGALLNMREKLIPIAEYLMQIVPPEEAAYDEDDFGGAIL